ncbi:TPA: ABC transporter permease [Streptococcus agalactiae]
MPKLERLNREFLKIKGTKIYLGSIYASIILTGFIVFKDVFMAESVRRIGVEKWVSSNILIGNFILLHMISIIFINLIIQREYSNNIIQNLLPYLKNRFDFIVGKIAIWFSLHLIITICSYLIALIGGLVIFKNLEYSSYIEYLSIIYLKTLILGFLILIPNLIVCIAQKKNYIVSFISGAITILLSVGFLQANNIIPYILPWSSAYILIFNANNPYKIWEMASIIIIVFISLFLALHILKKQEF